MNSELALIDSSYPMEKSVDKDLPASLDLLKSYLAEISKYPVLSRNEEHKIAMLAYEKNDREAAQKLVISNLRLVVKIALGYYNTYLNMLDLIQEGNVGLIHAVRKYDPCRGTKFSTYASFWIRAYILKHLMDSWSLVKVGNTQGQRRLFFRLKKEKRKLEALGICPTPKLLATTIGVKEQEVEDMEKRLCYNDVSLEAPVHDGSDDTLMDTLSSDSDVEEIVSERQRSAMLSKKVMEFKDKLDDRDTFIFDHRVMAEEAMTLDAIGMKFNISRERVRQVEQRMIKKLKEHFEGQAPIFGLQPEWKGVNERRA